MACEAGRAKRGRAARGALGPFGSVASNPGGVEVRNAPQEEPPQNMNN